MRLWEYTETIAQRSQEFYHVTFLALGKPLSSSPIFPNGKKKCDSFTTYLVNTERSGQNAVTPTPHHNKLAWPRFLGDFRAS